jgi:chromosomal replication initiation ATPase DnaA
VVEIMRRNIGPELVKAWLEKLQLVSLEGETVTFRAPSKFIGEWIETHLKHKLEVAWQSVAQDVKSVRIEVKATGKTS